MHRAGQRDRVKNSWKYVVYGSILVFVSACLFTCGVISTVYWYSDGLTDTYYFSGAYVCGIPGILLGLMYFLYFAKSRIYAEEKFTELAASLIKLENNISRFTLVIFALGLYSIPMAISGIVKHADNTESIHLVFSVCIMIICLCLFVTCAVTCLRLTSQGMRVKIVKESSQEITYNCSDAGSDSHETVFTVIHSDISGYSEPTSSVKQEDSTYF